ncbi:MAG: hypothetical protein RMY16_32235 [Nostoc sp. DedQUE12b]|uniref:hypothetical protein n=1 Tax=Nostoc sp. DedQUE12b TaxID=3075398 RepID=UPI002AD46569|nr:hypothetical protein [Nostoc sp. DedQUE12b]MDZ8090188.1 hypothetical protein [Nostoc sp. DedQUE12b]
MKIDINNALTIILGLLTLVGAIYRLAQVEANINAKINRVESTLLASVDQLKDNFVDRLYTVERKVDVHLTEYNEKKLFVEYRLNGIESMVKHKFDRLASWVKQIAGFLNKQSNFQIRDDKF